MLERFRRILVTTDFSEAGDHAILHAFRLAVDHEAEVVLLHVNEAVAPNPLYSHYYPKEALKESLDRAKQEASRALAERVPSDARLAAVRHRELVVEGMPVAEILATAKSEDVDLVVIATHGRTGLRHVLLGSVAERVIRHAHCPVLVVR